MIQTLKLRQQIKQRVIKELTPTSLIYEEATAKALIDREALASFPTTHEIYQTFASIRRKLVPPLPGSCMFDIPDQYKLTVNGERFRLFDESLFPASKRHGCQFHYSQCIFRQIQQLGLQRAYMQNEILRDLCRKLMSLTMMLEDTILDSYDEIRYHSRKLSGLPMEPLLNYFGKQWLSDIDIWNGSTISSRTTNCCE
ncbi:unnamed protein product, partial [Adineta steineri]